MACCTAFKIKKRKRKVKKQGRFSSRPFINATMDRDQKDGKIEEELKKPCDEKKKKRNIMPVRVYWVL